MKKTCIYLILLVALPVWARQNTNPPAPLLPVPSTAQLNWHNMELNAFIHFTINTFTDLEWGFGNESTSLFNPASADVQQWVGVLKDAGFKGIILTCKHHDGFCLWPSAFTDHSIKNAPYKNGMGDIVRELSDECKKQGMKFGIYLSPWDRNRADYGQQSYITYYRNQLKELLSGYGPVFEMWFDGANGGTGFYGGANEARNVDKTRYYDWPNTLNIVRSLQPDIILFSDAGPGVRWCGNERGYVNATNWNTITPDTLYAGKAGIEKLLETGSENGTRWIPAEADVSIRPGWFYHAKEDNKVKTAAQLFSIYLNTVGHGSLMLLNVPPDRSGRFHQNDVESLRGFHKLISQAFANNLALNATAKASAVRANSSQFNAQKLIDNNPETYWTTNDNIKTATIELNLNKPDTLHYIVLKEYIQLGQRVKQFSIDAFSNNQWIRIANATTIGHKRILPINPIRAKKLRINISDSRACPVLSAIEVY